MDLEVPETVVKNIQIDGLVRYVSFYYIWNHSNEKDHYLITIDKVCFCLNCNHCNFYTVLQILFIIADILR